MHKPFLLLLALFCVYESTLAQTITLTVQTTIHRSVRIRKQTYHLNGSDSLNRPVITISGDDIVVDFNGATLVGSKGRSRPDEFYGLAVRILSGRNITIKNLNAKGYKVALMAEGVEGLKLENCNLSYNYRRHLNSTQQKEDLSDWLSHHHNEHDEWLRYGAAIYLKNCNSAIISNCMVTGGQNALMMHNCDNAIIYNNDFSFNSGLGLGMYHCNNNKVLYNKLNFNVRGYSDGYYNRGQDSAGILVYEQSSDNLFYKNAVTHSGDGFFLWAGQTTMDTGQGGCNNNTLAENDFSYAPTHGIELTFSSNRMFHNRIFECDNGIWAGYSYNTDIIGNQFRNNHTAIAIEHGQQINIANNLFLADKQAIRLWADKEPADWNYPRFRNTQSKNYVIVTNSFNRNNVVYAIKNTDSLRVFDNRISFCAQVFKTDSSVKHLDSVPNYDILDRFAKDPDLNIPDIKNPADPFRGLGKLGGRKNIWITAWGPYDFRYPIIWNTNPGDTTGLMRFEVRGPARGRWKIVSVSGFENLSRTKDSFPSAFTATRSGNGVSKREIVAEYTGPAFTGQLGNRAGGPGRPERFRFVSFVAPVSFKVNWYAFDSLHNPVADTANIAAIVATAPIKTEKQDQLDDAWWYGIKAKDSTYMRFLTLAEGEGNFEPGLYDLGVTWDDAVKVYVDNRVVLSEWDPSKYNFDESPNRHIQMRLAGRHKIRVVHCNLDGFATLSVKITPSGL